VPGRFKALSVLPPDTKVKEQAVGASRVSGGRVFATSASTSASMSTLSLMSANPSSPPTKSSSLLNQMASQPKKDKTILKNKERKIEATGGDVRGIGDNVRVMSVQEMVAIRRRCSSGEDSSKLPLTPSLQAALIRNNSRHSTELVLRQRRSQELMIKKKGTPAYQDSRRGKEPISASAAASTTGGSPSIAITDDVMDEENEDGGDEECGSGFVAGGGGCRAGVRMLNGRTSSATTNDGDNNDLDGGSSSSPRKMLTRGRGFASSSSGVQEPIRQGPRKLQSMHERLLESVTSALLFEASSSFVEATTAQEKEEEGEEEEEEDTDPPMTVSNLVVVSAFQLKPDKECFAPSIHRTHMLLAPKPIRLLSSPSSPSLSPSSEILSSKKTSQTPPKMPLSLGGAPRSPQNATTVTTTLTATATTHESMDDDGVENGLFGTALPTQQGSVGTGVELFAPENVGAYCSKMEAVRGGFSLGGGSDDGGDFVLVYHYTRRAVVPRILDKGLCCCRATIERRGGVGGMVASGGGGVYFSTLGPASYGLGTHMYEENLIVDCFGEERLCEYKGKGNLDVCLVCRVDPRVLRQAPGAGGNRTVTAASASSNSSSSVVVPSEYFEAFGAAKRRSIGSADCDEQYDLGRRKEYFYLHPHMIVAAFDLGPGRAFRNLLIGDDGDGALPGRTEASEALKKEVEYDAASSASIAKARCAQERNVNRIAGRSSKGFSAPSEAAGAAAATTRVDNVSEQDRCPSPTPQLPVSMSPSFDDVMSVVKNDFQEFLKVMESEDRRKSTGNVQGSALGGDEKSCRRKEESGATRGRVSAGFTANVTDDGGFDSKPNMNSPGKKTPSKIDQFALNKKRPSNSTPATRLSRGSSTHEHAREVAGVGRKGVGFAATKPPRTRFGLPPMRNQFEEFSEEI